MRRQVEPQLRILTVCLGNVCRSPLMERLLRARLPDDVLVESAGLIATPGASMDERAGAELTRLGGTSHGFAARRFAPQQAGAADLVLTATADVKSRVLEECPAALRRTFTLLEFAHLVEQSPPGSARERIAWVGRNRSLAAGRPTDVVDPIGRDATVHREAADAIDRATATCAACLGS
jgi:protein-tyrosine phosphatase